jgi:hypothetical protein
MKKRIALCGLAVSALVLAACNETSTLARPSAPVVLTGADVPDLVGVAPSSVVAFSHAVVDDVGEWTQVPVQVDERVVVPFGTQPGNNTSAGTTGTVYGNGSGGPTALQYADPTTWVGADSDPTIDGDDEIVFMGFDTGGQARAETGDPAGVVPGSGVMVKVVDTLGENERGWVYLYRSAGTLDPSAGQDYVDYDFNLTSGNYKTTYKRADGPNLETSVVTTPSYRIGFSDRWYEDSWEVLASGATGVDILDGHKAQFALSTCGRSNQTFADAEGAFVANIDGPVRAIRSYVGANSGPLTQRTHLMYRDREDVTTNLRVHSIGGVMDFMDYSAAASGMTYRNSANTAGVAVDGSPDSVSSTLPTWEAVDGPQGRVYSTNEVGSSLAGIVAGTNGFHLDDTTPAEPECWGDGDYYGASGLQVQTPIANTDPRSSPFGTLSVDRVNAFLPPAANSGEVAADAQDWADDLATPLDITVGAFQP